MPKAEGKNIQKSKNGAVELLRIVTITLILFHHYQQIYGIYHIGGINFYNGRFPFQYLVEMLFLLSGYLAWRYHKRICEGLSFGTYLKERVWRLFPGMVIADLACYALMYFYYRSFGSYWMDIPINKGRLLITLLGMGSGWFVEGTRINSPTWYVSVLFLCLILLFILTKLAQKLKKPMWIFSVAMIVLGLICWGLNLYTEIGFVPFWDIYSCRGYYAFFMGLLLAELQEKKAIPQKGILIWLGIGIGTLVCFLLIPGPYRNWINVLLAMVICPPVLLLLVSDKAEAITKGRKVIPFLGKMSYSVFLWHVPFIIAMWFYLMRENIFLDLKNPVVMILYAIAAWAVGILCYFVLELPFRMVLQELGRIFGAKKNDN